MTSPLADQHKVVREDVKAFIAHLNAHEGGRSTREKFRDFVTVAYHSIAKTMAHSREEADKHEAAYMDKVGEYRDKAAFSEYAKVLALAQKHAGYYFDFLGVVSGEVGALSGDMGQFFTPMGVSRLLSRMVTDDKTDAIIARDGYIKFSEPAVGAGGIVLAQAEALFYRNHNPSTTMLVQARDLSAVAYEMCYVQLALAGIPALVIHGNTINLETFRYALTPACIVFYQEHGHLDLGYESAIGDPNGPGMIYPPLCVPKSHAAPRTRSIQQREDVFPQKAEPTIAVDPPEPITEPTRPREELHSEPGQPEQLRLF